MKNRHARFRIYKQIEIERQRHLEAMTESGINTEKDLSVAEWLLIIQHRLHEARIKLGSLDEAGAIVELTRMAQLCVGCLEYNKKT